MPNLHVLGGALVIMLSIGGCASTTAYIQLPDGTMIEVDDNKSREGVIVSWKKTEEGFEVFLSSQKSGTDPSVTSVINKSLDIVHDSVTPY